MSDKRMDELVLRVAARPPDASGRRARRRRVIGGIAIAFVASGGVAAAAALFRGQPDAPHEGAVCRAEARASSSGIALARGADPIEDCRDLWLSGSFEEFGIRDREPPLTACIGAGGVVEVFPAESTVCDALGLPIADSELSPENERIVELQERVSTEINGAGCVPVQEAFESAESILESMGLLGWTVVVGPDSEGGDCGKVAIDPTGRELVVTNHREGG